MIMLFTNETVDGNVEVSVILPINSSLNQHDITNLLMESTSHDNSHFTQTHSSFI
nr:MAG TPA: hypothetical protein [Caudoviricetes sp.]